MATQILGKVGMVLKGEYNNATNYQKLDVVIYNGQSYVAKENTTGNLPTNTTYWQLLAEKGYTPIKGTDYFTEQDIQDMENDVKEAVEDEIPDVSNFITKDVNNLTYYKKTTEINDDLALKQNKTDNSLQTTNKTIPSAINEVNSIAKGANQALSYINYDTMVTAFNVLENNVYNAGQNIMIVTLEVPDLWISGIEQTKTTYNFTTDEAFVNELKTNGYVKVGYYKISVLETQKVDLKDYAKTEDIPTTLAELTDDSTHRLVTDTEKTTWDSKGTYSKPSGGIPKSDLSNSVQSSLGKADSALQEHQDISGKMDKTDIVLISQEDYDALEIKNKIYFVPEEE